MLSKVSCVGCGLPSSGGVPYGLANHTHQVLKHLLKQFPRTVPIRVGEREAYRRALHADVVEFADAGLQPAGDHPKALACAKWQ